MTDKLVGKVTHYYDKIGVAVVSLTGTLKAGDEIKVVRGDEEFTQTVESMQTEHARVSTAKKGDSIGLKISQTAKPGSKIFLVS